MDNTKRPFEEYSKEVFRHLKEFGNFKDPSEEAIEYLESSEVEDTIRSNYDRGQPAESCAWVVDMLY